LTTMTPELRAAIEQAGTEPARLVDPETQTAYILMREEEYDRIRTTHAPSGEATPEAMYPFIDEAFGLSGWDDPKMDDYNDYESHRP